MLRPRMPVAPGALDRPLVHPADATPASVFLNEPSTKRCGPPWVEIDVKCTPRAKLRQLFDMFSSTRSRAWVASPQACVSRHPRDAACSRPWQTHRVAKQEPARSRRLPGGSYLSTLQATGEEVARHHPVFQSHSVCVFERPFALILALMVRDRKPCLQDCHADDHASLLASGRGCPLSARGAQIQRAAGDNSTQLEVVGP